MSRLSGEGDAFKLPKIHVLVRLRPPYFGLKSRGFVVTCGKFYGYSRSRAGTFPPQFGKVEPSRDYSPDRLTMYAGIIRHDKSWRSPYRPKIK